MKYVEACLSAREDRERNFHRCGGPVRCLFMSGKDLTKLF